MAVVVRGRINSAAYAPQVVFNQVRGIYDNIFQGYGAGGGGSVLATSFDPQTNAPLNFICLCPKRATSQLADQLFLALQGLLGTLGVYGQPQQFGPFGNIQKFFLDPIVDGQSSKSNPAVWPADAPDGFCSNFAQPEIDLVVSNGVTGDFTEPIFMTNSDLSVLPAQGWTFTPFPPFHAPTAWNAYDLDAGFPRHRNHPAHWRQVLVEEVYNNGFLWFYAPYTNKTLYDASQEGLVDNTNENILDANGEMLAQIKTPPVHGVKIGDKKLRFKFQGKWYVVAISGHNNANLGIENCYNQQGELEFTWASKHPDSYSFYWLIEGQGLAPTAYVMEGDFGIRQGDDDAGPLLDEKGLLSEGGKPSTILSIYPCMYTPSKMRYSALADKDKWIL